MARATYETFPLRLALLSVLLALSIYALGAYILSGFTPLTVGLYIAYCLGIELSVLRGTCVHCYYYGKVCGLGRGRICSLFFKRGDPRRFLECQVCWNNMIPDLLVSLIPLIGGIFLLIDRFSWSRIGAIGLLALLSSGGNAEVRRGYACKYCKQKELGCPAVAKLWRSGGV